MVKLKQRIENLETLENLFNKLFKNGEEIILSTEKTRNKLTRNRRAAIFSLTFFIVSIALVGSLPLYVSNPPVFFWSFLVIGLGILSFVYTKKWFLEHETLAKEINMSLIPLIIACFDRQALYINDKSQLDEVREVLNKSELLTERIDMVVADDSFTFFEPFKITIRELMATRTEQRGKRSVAVTVFKGVFVEVDLNKRLEGVTFVSTEGNKSGFGHVGFFTNLLGLGDIKETALEWNEFERDLHVATNNEMEARYVLTPDFMVDLHDWWSEEKENIRIVFRENKMFMLLPDRGVHINRSTVSNKSEDLKDYAFSMVKPLWRTLILVEDIRV
jgi:hypothetical protein